MAEVNLAHPGLAAVGAIVHLLLAGACIINWKRDRRTASLFPYWLVLGIFQVFFAFDAWIGIRFMIGDLGRTYFLAHGWYGHRRPFQAITTMIAVGSVVLGARWVIIADRRPPFGCRTAIAGTAVLVAVFLNTSISLHQTTDFTLSIIGRALGCTLTGVGAYLAVPDRISMAS